jgi:hypothetical protein
LNYLFLFVKFHQKKKLKIKKIQNKLFWRFSVANSGENKLKNKETSIFGFQCVAKNIER